MKIELPPSSALNWAQRTVIHSAATVRNDIPVRRGCSERGPASYAARAAERTRQRCPAGAGFPGWPGNFSARLSHQHSARQALQDAVQMLAHAVVLFEARGQVTIGVFEFVAQPPHLRLQLHVGIFERRRRLGEGSKRLRQRALVEPDYAGFERVQQRG